MRTDINATVATKATLNASFDVSFNATERVLVTITREESS